MMNTPNDMNKSNHTPTPWTKGDSDLGDYLLLDEIISFSILFQLWLGAFFARFQLLASLYLGSAGKALKHGFSIRSFI